MYYLLFAFYALLVFIPVRYKKIRVIISALPLILFGFIRYGVGADYFTYQESYNRFLNNIPLDIGYLLKSTEFIVTWVIQAIAMIGVTFQVAIGLITLSFITLTSILIYKKSENISLSFLLLYSSFYFVWGISALRQSLVLGILSLLVFGDFKISRKLKIALVLALSLVHISALVLVGYLLLEPIQFDRNKHLKIFIICIFISLLPWHTIISGLNNGFSEFLLPYLSDEGSIFMFSKVARILLFLIVYIHYERLSESVYYKTITDIYLFGLSVFFIMSPSEVLAARYAIYSYFALILILPKIISFYGSISKSYVLMLILIFSATYLIKDLNSLQEQTGMQHKKNHVPMTTIFDKNKVEFNRELYYRGGQN